MMNNKLFLISLLISFSVQVFAQDVLPHRAPIDDSISSFEDSMKNDEGDSSIWLYQLAEHYGIDYETKQISVRGHIYWAEY